MKKWCLKIDRKKNKMALKKKQRKNAKINSKYRMFVTRCRICIVDSSTRLHGPVGRRLNRRRISRTFTSPFSFILSDLTGAHSRTTYRGISLARVYPRHVSSLFSLTRSRCTLGPTLLETLLILSWRYPGVCGWMRAANWVAVNPLQRCVCRSAFIPLSPPLSSRAPFLNWFWWKIGNN